MKLFVRNLQSALFTPSLDLSDKIGLSNQLIKTTKGVFDGDPIILPLPDDAPPEIPRIILKNKNGSNSMNISSTRVDIFYNGQSIEDGLPTKELSEVAKPYLGNSITVIRAIRNITHARIVRLGFISTLQTTNESSSEFVRDSYLKLSEVTKDIYDISLGILKRTKVGKQKVNVWFRVNSFRRPGDPLDDKLLTVQFDINTLPEDLLDLDSPGIVNFFEHAIKYIRENLDTYLKTGSRKTS